MASGAGMGVGPKNRGAGQVRRVVRKITSSFAARMPFYTVKGLLAHNRIRALAVAAERAGLGPRFAEIVNNCPANALRELAGVKSVGKPFLGLVQRAPQKK